MKNMKMILEQKFKLNLIKGYAGDEDNFEAWLDELTDGDDSDEEIEPDVEEEVEEETPEEEPEQDVEEEAEEEDPGLEQPEDQKKPVVAKKQEVAKPGVKEAPVKKTPEEEQAEIQAFMGELQKQYALTDEDADAILTDPKTVLPKLMANAHAMILRQVGQYMQQAMPQFVESQVRNVSTTDQRLNEFSEMYPDLVLPENQQAAMTALQTIKQANPNMPYPELLKKVGPVAYALLGKEPPAKKDVVAPVAKAKPKPHIPAKTASSTPAPKDKSTDPTVAFFESLSRF